MVITDVLRKHHMCCASPPLCCREEGLAGLWKGLGPNIARNAIINAAELASYDQIKVSLLATGRAGQGRADTCKHRTPVSQLAVRASRTCAWWGRTCSLSRLTLT